MSREILFKAKRIDNGEWIRGDLITTPFIPYILDIINADYDCFEDLNEGNGIFEVDPETVCQYTGLTDKSGRKIFEGDIVKVYERTAKEYLNNKVSYVGGSFLLIKEHYLNAHLGDYIKNELEVIGNIFDNSELLEGSKEHD